MPAGQASALRTPMTNTQLDRILGKLKGVRPCADGQYRALCPVPAHDDHKPSLSVGLGKEGKVILHCHSGCSAEAITEALGLSMSDLFPSQPPAFKTLQRPAKKQGTLTVAALAKDKGLPEEFLREVGLFEKNGTVMIPYRLEDGSLAPRQRIRTALHAGDGSRWTKGEGAVVPYGLDRLNGAREAGYVVLVEGESDSWTLRFHGFPVLGIPGADMTGKIQADHLRGIPRLFVMKEQDRGGETFVAGVARRLMEIAWQGEARVISLPDGAKDPNELHKLDPKGFKAAFQEALNTAKPLSPPEPSTNTIPGTDYLCEDGIFWLKSQGDAPPTRVPLADFVPDGPRLLTMDDGVERTMRWQFEGRTADGKRLPRVDVSTADFAGLGWVPRVWPKARVYPGQAVKDRLRDALTCLLRDAPEQTVFTHAGWREIAGAGWVFLLPGQTLLEGMECRLDDQAFGHYRLPAPPTSRALTEAVRASLAFLDVADRSITWPLWAAVYRAPTANLMWPAMVLWLFGLTGSLKSSLTALALCHYGDFMGDTLPGSWLSTDNALEAQLFAAKDLLFVVDDYAPEQHRHKAQELEARANRIIRQIGNHSARSRRRADMSAAPDRPPRAMVIATGEQLPLGVGSVGARILPVRVDRKLVDLRKLTAAQRETAAQYSAAMAGYINWLRPRIPGLRESLPDKFQRLRDSLSISGHLRLPESVAHLFLGAGLGLQFARESGAITEEEQARMLEECRGVLTKHAEDHAKRLQEERPTALFLRILAELMEQGKAYLSDRTTDGRPMKEEDRQRFGWPMEGEPQGEKLGWVDSTAIYLLPEAAFNAVSKVAQANGGFPIREHTLRDHLCKEGLIVPVDDGRTAASLRMAGRKVRVLRLNRSALEIS